jgi:hypothetical protein
MRRKAALIVSMSIGATACSSSGSNPASKIVGNDTAAPATQPVTTEASAPSTQAGTTTGGAGSTGSTPVTAAGSAFSGTVTFAWPRDCSVPVREEIAKNGTNGETSWNLGLTGEGANLVVALNDFSVDTINGDKVPAAQLDQISAAFQIPPFVVGPDGQVLETRGMDEFIGKVGPLLGLNDESMYPFVTSALEISIRSQTWAPWAGAWAALGDIEAGSTDYESTQETDVGSVVTPFVVESLPDAPAGQAHFRFTETLEGEAFAQLLGNTLQQIAGTQPPVASGIEGTRVTIYDAYIDPTTLRPFVTSFDQTTTATDGTKTQTKSENRRTTFDWNASTCEVG